MEDRRTPRSGKDLDVLYHSDLGVQLHGDSRQALSQVDDGSVDLVITSPPFALLREKAYGNVEQESYVSWFSPFAEQVHRVLKDTGSFVLDLGGAYKRGRPVRSLYQYRLLLDLCDRLDFELAEEFFWHNPSKLPSPTEWVNKRKIRATDAVNTIWWLSKTDFPKSDISQVRREYSDSMKAQMTAGGGTGERPSEHDVSETIWQDRGGALPDNLLQISNTASNTRYQRTCRELSLKRHPARFPKRLPSFFVRMLTDPGDVVLDFFSGSNTTGFVAEKHRRRWISVDLDRAYARNSIARFLDVSVVGSALEVMDAGERVRLEEHRMQGTLFDGFLDAQSEGDAELPINFE